MDGLATCLVLLFCTLCSTVKALDSDKHKCGATHGHRMRRHTHEVFPQRSPTGNKYGYALQFETGQAIQYLNLRSPSKKFSVDFWMKPEGGQNNPAIVLNAYDKCAPEDEARGWSISLGENAVTSDLRVYFTVHTASAHSKKSIKSHSKIEPKRWYHVAATYDGTSMTLYVNQAKVAVGNGQKGTIFDSTTQNHACDLLEVGGDVKRGLYYRGEIDKLRLWNEAISHLAITQSLPENSIDSVRSKIVKFDDFNEINIKDLSWIPITDKYPRFVRSTVPEDKHDLAIRKPPCGKTICDNPEVIRSYLNHPDSRGSKHLKIRFINVMDDDGSRPMLTDSEINSQFKLMQSTFSQYNISWEMAVESVRNTWLRNKTVLHVVGCEVEMIGNNVCELQCNLDITSWDGGDCIRENCPPEKVKNGICDPERKNCPTQKIKNGICDPECNSVRFEYDGGDCCIGNISKMCIDPNSNNRRYCSVNEYKKAVGFTNKDALNVYIVNWTAKNLQGTSTFPWQKTVHTELGGVVLTPKNFANTKVLIHEIGHILGLWHIHHGSSSEMMCSDDCFETFPSLELGDLCSDTNPTLVHTTCSDPVVSQENMCGLHIYTNTLYNNYMGYANDSCTDHFTPQQVARMHCYIDLDYQSWQTNVKPSFVPLRPRITEAKGNRIKLSWLPPLGPGGKNAINLCNSCDDEHILEQYATTAFSPVNSANAPHQAIGPPDADYCDMSKFSWQPSDMAKIYCPDCPLFLEVGFKEAVIPKEITIWVPHLDGQSHTFSDIVLVYLDGSVESIGNGTAQCDSPFTKPLYVNKKVVNVRIFVPNYEVCIDAVKLTSGIKHPNCSKCKSLHYVIRRTPPFDTGHEKNVPTAHFEDNNIDKKGRYEYMVKAVTYDNVAGPFSPKLIYEASRGFCGDGKIDEGENCDDGNIRDGDGCNIQCEMEDVFRCAGRPSLCYRHDGDGVCEEFEKTTSIKDCGFYTPKGFKDQWVSRATSNPEYKYDCELDSIIGPPRTDLKCEFSVDALKDCGDGWIPLNENNWLDIVQNDWLNIYFKTPAIASALVVYLATVVPDRNIPSPLIKFELHGAKSNEKMSTEYRVANCSEYPVTIPIHHDMTKPFFKTHFIQMKFSTNIKVAAVALRSPKYFDPVRLQDCTGSQLFHPSTQKCHNYECNMPTCSKLMLKHAVQIKKCKKGSLEGSTCKVRCATGFTPVAPFDIMCSGGEWLVDGETPQCIPVDCGKPRIQNAEIHCPDGTTFGKKCIYKCKDGAKPVGNGAELSVTCEADSMWSDITTFCRKTCLLPPTPPYSKLLSKNCHKGKPFMPGESCKYRCKPGYKPSGLYTSKLYRVGFVQQCLKGGTWTTTRCVPVTCPVRDPKIFQWYNCTLGNAFGSVCRLACPGEKIREARCSAEGKWDKKLQFCPLTKGSCPRPNLSEGVLSNGCAKHPKPGDECKIRCDTGLKPVVKGDSLKRELKVIVCSPFLQWYPDLSAIKCIPKCHPVLFENGFCDGINNNEECDFDRGDCCDPNTIKTESSCSDDECECKDETSPYYGTIAFSGDGRSSS